MEMNEFFDDYYIRYRCDEMKKALIEKYQLDLKSTWKEIWNHMKGLKELDTAKIASEEWAKILLEKSINDNKEPTHILEEQLVVFKAILTSMIEHELKKQEESGKAEVQLNVEDNPCIILGYASKFSRINDSAFPSNIKMTVTKKSVVMSNREGNEIFKYSAQEAHNDGEMDDGCR